MLAYSQFNPRVPGFNKYIATFVIENQKGLPADHYLCLEQLDLKSKLLIEQIKKEESVAIVDIPGQGTNCFAPAFVSSKVAPRLDEIVKRLDQNAGENLKGYFPIFKSKEAQAWTEGFKLRNQDRTLGRKLLRAELLIGGSELTGMGILVALPKSVTKWEDDWMQSAAQNLKRAWTKPPVWDKDEWAINYIGHPLAGAMYYNALRSQGATRMESFVYSTVQSTFWEYVVEGIAEQPSIQDLIYTPVVGSFIGELAHLATLRMKYRGFNTLEKIIVTVINPTYVLNNGYK